LWTVAIVICLLEFEDWDQGPVLRHNEAYVHVVAVPTETLRRCGLATQHNKRQPPLLRQGSMAIGAQCQGGDNDGTVHSDELSVLVLSIQPKQYDVQMRESD
jgi:hypothetical protein